MYGSSQDADAILVQAGWHAFSRDAVLLGEVISADQHRIVIENEGEHWQFATDLVRDQEEAEMRVNLDIDADQAERVGERVR